jgi:hypothetical protein
MQCPTCKEERTRIYWRPSQWIHEKPVIHWFRQCKVCDLELPPPPWSHYGSNSSSSTTSSRTSQPAAPPADVADLVPIEALELIELMVGFQTEKASKFVAAWMDLPHKVRKAWSHSGAVQCRDATAPVHYHCKLDGRTYFDPGNWIYAVTLSVMCPELMAHRQWNYETKGDICESIMGCQYEVEHGLMTGATGESLEFPHLQKYGGITSAIVDAFAWYVWRLCGKVGDRELIVWINWTIDMVRYQRHQPRADSSSLPELLRLDTMAEYHGPKDKSLGNLTSGPPLENN